MIRIPIVGLGGIEKADDIADYILAGATAVEVGTAHFADPQASVKLVANLEQWCETEKLNDVNNLRGDLKH